MKRRSPLIHAFVFTGFVTVSLWGQAPAKTLGEPTRSVFLADRVLGREPRYENGFHAILDVGSSPRVLLYNMNGQLERANDLALPDAVQVDPVDVSVSRQGRVAVAGAAVNSGGSQAAMVLIFDRPGPPSLVIRTNPFVTFRVAVSADGHIWTIGLNRDAEKQKEDYGVIQKYAPDGRMVGQFVLRSSFPAGVDPGAHGSGGKTALRATRNGVYAHVAGAREWLELDNGGNLLGRWKPQPPSDTPRATVYEVAFTDSGSVYAHWQLGPRRGLYRLDKSSGTWKHIAGADIELNGPLPIAGALAGADGNQLVFHGLNRELLWFEEPR